ncbi:UNVERIFIED_CONTAM: hypothetical protein FKN15_021521 [Acipenser sinensis]
MPGEELTFSLEAVPSCPEEEGTSTELTQSDYETGQEQGNAGGEEVGVVGGEREEESAPASQPQPEPVRTEEEAIQSRKETGADPPTPRPRTKRVSQSLSQTGSELNTAITENGEEPFRDVVKKKRFKQKTTELPDGRAQQVQSSEPVLTGRLQAPAGAPVPHNAGEENTVEGGPNLSRLKQLWLGNRRRRQRPVPRNWKEQRRS